MANSTLVIIPTYDEIENLPLIVGRVFDANDDVDILIVDDNSPDGTGQKADELAETNDRLHTSCTVLARKGYSPRTATVSTGDSSVTMRLSARWTPMARMHLRSFTACWRRSKAAQTS